MSAARTIRVASAVPWQEIERDAFAAAFCQGTAASLAALADEMLSARARTLRDVAVAAERNGAKLTAEVLVAEARRFGVLDELGGVPGIADVFASMTTAANLDYFVGQIRERAAVRRFEELTRGAAQPDTRPASVRAADLMGALGPLALDDGEAPVEAAVDVALRFSKSLDQRVDGAPAGLRVGLRLFDDFDLLVRGTLVVVGARPSVGKTALAARLARAAAKDGAGSFVATCEMSPEDFMARLVAAESGVDLRVVRRPRGADHALLERIHRASARIGEMPLYLWGPSSTTVERLEAAVVAKRAACSFGLVVVDYLQLIAERRKGETDEASVARVSKTLKRIARRLDVCVVGLSQLNRGNERDGRAPRLSDLRSSGAIEQDADVCVLLHRPGRTDSERPPEWLDLDVAKHRNGPLTIRRVRYDLETQRFEDFPDRSEAMDDLWRQINGGSR